MKIKINSIETLISATDELGQYYNDNKHFTLEMYVKRSVSANALQHKWYWAIGKQTGYTEKYIKNYCKYHFGMPILFRRNDQDSSLLMEFMKAQNWERWAMKWGMSIEEAKMEIVGTQQVTSLFKKHESTEYMQSIQNHYEPQNILLPTKDDL